MLARSRALQALHREREAADLLDRVLALEPGNRDAWERRAGLRDAIRQWQAGFNYSYEWFNRDLVAWSELQFTARRQTAAGSVIGRFSRADRFGFSSRQTELEFYPRLRRGTYGYLDLGYSPDARLYPRFRFGADLFQSLGRGFEGSGGMRRLSFASPVNIYTASLAKYHGNWLFHTRLYLTPGAAGASHSTHFSARRYFGDGAQYIAVRFARGNAPVETRTLADVGILNSTGLYSEIDKSIGRRWTFNLSGGLSQEDRFGRSALRHRLLQSNLYFRF
jgi:YaiO family outer membrane protein